ncbi:MAG: aspartate/glutamate racemase family protein [Pseudomonadota bacterium]|nr:aspartate/glutamate racemase family protein [Pseudomonadota bacterium]
MTKVPYETSEPDLPALGLIALRVDETLEPEFHRMIPPDTARLYVSRVQSGDTLSPESIAHMADNLATSTALLPSGGPLSVVGYACTSGTALIGEDRVTDLVRQNSTAQHVTNPLTASVAQMKALGVSSIGVVSPYVDSVSGPLCDAFTERGITVSQRLSFGEEIEAQVARITPASIAKAARHIAQEGGCDAIFLSCTNLRTLDILQPLMLDLNMPVLSSNHALAWHMKLLAGLETD